MMVTIPKVATTKKMISGIVSLASLMFAFRGKDHKQQFLFSTAG